MDDDTHLAMMGLALCDALSSDAFNPEAHAASVDRARKHAHAVINRGKRKETGPRCVCPDEQRGDCDCRDVCTCAE